MTSLLRPDNLHFDSRNIPKIDATLIKKILIIQYDPVGDSILNIPLFRNIKKAFPHIRTAYLINELPYSLLKDTEGIDEFVVYKKQSKKGFINYLKYLLNDFFFLFKVRSVGADCVIDLIGKPKSALVTLCSGAKFRIGRDLRGRGWCYNYKYYTNGHDYTVWQRLTSLTVIGLDLKKADLGYRLTFGPAEKQKADLFYKTSGIGIRDLKIILSVNQRISSRQWLAENFAQLGDRLVKRNKAKIIILWGPDEKNHAEKVRSLMKNKKSAFLIPDTTYKEMAAIIAQADGVVANCSGPKHVSTGVGRVVVTIFGPTHPEVWEHYQTGRNFPVQAKGLDCLSCEKNTCPRDRHYCMEMVTSEKVYRVLLEALKKKK